MRWDVSLNFKGSPLNVKYYGCIIEVFYASFLVVYERGGGVDSDFWMEIKTFACNVKNQGKYMYTGMSILSVSFDYT